MSHKTPDRVPVDMWFNDDSWAKFSNAVGAEDLSDFFRTDVRRIFFNPVNPLAALEPYPFPDRKFAFCTVENLKAKTEAIHEKNLAVEGCPGSVCFEIATAKCGGLENILVSLAEGDSSLKKLLKEIADAKIDMMMKYASAGVDVIGTGDDFGTQRGLMMSPDMWREWFKPFIREAVEKVKNINPETAVKFHSDGNIWDIIPDLIECGIDIINPVQPECMNIGELKKSFGNDICFWGGIGTQHVLPFGTPDEVKEDVRKTCSIMGGSGGFILCSSHMVQEQTPLENVFAFFEAAKQC